MFKKMCSTVISEDQYKGVPVQKIRFENGTIAYYSYGVWFDDFTEFAESVEAALLEKKPIEKKNNFAEWLTDGKDGGALEMMAAYSEA